METDYQRTYNEAMAKLGEAQSCQSDIVRDLKTLQEINDSITRSNGGWWNWSNYITQCITGHFRRNYYLNRQITTRTKERNENLNDALAKALDLIDDETDKGVSYINSLGSQALGAILSFIALNSICIQYSTEVDAKQFKLIAKGCFQSLKEELKRFGN